MWFSPEKVAIETAPPIDREAALLEQLRSVESELAALNYEIFEFRQKYSLLTNRFQQIVACRGDSLSARPEIELQWRILRKRVDALFPRRNKLLQEFARLKVPDYA